MQPEVAAKQNRFRWPTIILPVILFLYSTGTRAYTSYVVFSTFGFEFAGEYLRTNWLSLALGSVGFIVNCCQLAGAAKGHAVLVLVAGVFQLLLASYTSGAIIVFISRGYELNVFTCFSLGMALIQYVAGVFGILSYRELKRLINTAVYMPSVNYEGQSQYNNNPTYHQQTSYPNPETGENVPLTSAQPADAGYSKPGGYGL
eukprot:TRINITY_DN334_c0_g2_i1.p1 TRINITY_DN334_c0_g2~~TRINITY_DN334_c0_g2_i1.p1  ORF type:complete len:234 (+),score=45.29 TRINITY_DN334_c0_g2_i1:97-702(+)